MATAQRLYNAGLLDTVLKQAGAGGIGSIAYKDELDMLINMDGKGAA